MQTNPYSSRYPTNLSYPCNDLQTAVNNDGKDSDSQIEEDNVCISSNYNNGVHNNKSDLK